MKNQILSQLDHPDELEKLYRSDKSEFKQAFLSLYPEIKEKEIASFWQVRLNYGSDAISWGSQKEFLWIILSILLAGIFVKIPAIFGIDEDFFYPRNISFIVLPLISAYFAWKNQLSSKIKIILGFLTIVLLIYVNLLPGTENDTLILVCIHLPIILWGILGATYSGPDYLNPERRLSFLRFNGEAAIMSVLLGIGGMLLTGITFGLFELIGIKIQDFYTKYVIAFGLPAIPILGSYLTHTNPSLVGKVAPLIAKIFSPLVLTLLFIYLGAILLTGKDPYNDREFLLIFNLLLIGVMALIFFSVAEHFQQKPTKSNRWILFLLASITILVNAIALSAIIFRISEWGITPNRLAVLGSNVLMLVHLVLVAQKLYKTAFESSELGSVGKVIARYIPIYLIWAALVVFLFPVIFGFQ